MMATGGRSRTGTPVAIARLAFALASCGLFGEPGSVRIAAMGAIHSAARPLNGELSTTNAAVLDATSQRLLSYDGQGQIDAGLADR